ncbi:MAG TPA: hypothetical protein VK644_04580 [Chitinophagaceae bacterium]|nr:hypothetical protein [Chitinophagaceae bacterium]
MQTFKIWLLSGFLFSGCNNGGGKDIQVKDTTALADSQSAISTTTATMDTTISGCYSMINKRDTAALQLEVRGGDASGTLSYNFYQKDRNDGSFQGEVGEGLVHGYYLFHSEGVMSVREVAWKVKDQRLWPAMGEMKEQNDSMLFVNPSKLNYDSTRVFVKVKCLI